MLNKLRQKLNNSASLGKTLARAQQPQHHSYFVEPRQFDIQSFNESREFNKKLVKKEGISTPKLSAPRAVPANLCVGDSLAKIQLNRQKCSKLGQDVHTASVDKNLKLNRMFRDLHHFYVCVDELKWLLSQGDTLIRAYLSQAVLVAPHSSHTLDISNISQEFRSLVLRFAHIEKHQLNGIQQFMDLQQINRACERTNPYLGMDEIKIINPEGKQLPTYPQGESIVLSKEKNRPSYNSYYTDVETRHFSVPLKENLNSSNLPHFDNIKITKSQTTKLKSGVTHQKEGFITMNNSIQERQEDSIRQKDDLYSKLRAQHEKNQQLSGKIQMLKDEIQSLEGKLSKYKVFSYKSIENLSQPLRKLMNPLSQQQKQFQLLKMAQIINNWQKMMEDDIQQAKYRQIYGNSQAIKTQKTKQLQQIIHLQYEINNLLGQRNYLQKIQANQLNRTIQRSSISQDIYRMLAAQAITLEQLCQF